MKKLKLNIAALFFYFFGSAQQKQDSVYENRPLKIDEINFISGYYSQEGNHSAIMGGNGSEKLSDLSNTLDLKLIKQSNRFEHSFDINLAAEHRTSASTAYIEKSPEGATTILNTLKNQNFSSKSKASGSSGSNANSSASALYGWRLYPSLNWSMKDLKTNTTYGIGGYYSYEFDYQSLGAEISLIKASLNNNREFSIKGQAFFDQREMIIPHELRSSNYKTSWQGKNSYSINTAFSQIVNQRIQFSVLLDWAYQKGILSTPYNRVYFSNNTVSNEKLPDSRMKIPVGLRFNYFIGNNIIMRLYYRYYWDNWNMTAHTTSIEIPVKLNPNFSISPFYRFHTQTGTKYFNEYNTANPLDQYYTSDYDLSKFQSNNIGLNFHFVPNNWGVFNAIDFRYSYYKRNDGLSANNFTIALKFK